VQPRSICIYTGPLCAVGILSFCMPEISRLRGRSCGCSCGGGGGDPVSPRLASRFQQWSARNMHQSVCPFASRSFAGLAPEIHGCGSCSFPSPAADGLVLGVGEAPRPRTTCRVERGHANGPRRRTNGVGQSSNWIEIDLLRTNPPACQSLEIPSTQVLVWCE
jgi:hypothetical protein